MFYVYNVTIITREGCISCFNIDEYSMEEAA